MSNGDLNIYAIYLAPGDRIVWAGLELLVESLDLDENDEELVIIQFKTNPQSTENQVRTLIARKDFKFTVRG